MELFSLTTPKSGLEDSKNEDSIHIRHIKKNNLMVLVSDGASTGVFSREWSNHITHNFDPEWLTSTEDFESGLTNLRESFKPEIKRPTALRKFLQEGSYATLLALQIDRIPNWFWHKYKMISYGVGDVCYFVFTKEGELEYSFPYTNLKDFNNVPHLIRTSQSLQEQTPYEVKIDTHSTASRSLIVVASDALSEFLFQSLERQEAFKTVQEIMQCKNNEEFKDLINHYRQDYDMKNDDVSVCLITDKPELYLPKGS